MCSKVWIQAALSTLFLFQLGSPGLAAPPEELQKRRGAVMDQLGGGVLILLGAEAPDHPAELTAPPRQKEDFLYLTGIEDPGCRMIVTTAGGAEREILFLPEPSKARDLWTGPGLDATAARALSGINEIRPLSSFDALLQGIVTAETSVYLALGSPVGRGEEHEESLVRKLKSNRPGLSINSAERVIHELRVIKSEFEISQIAKSLEITGNGIRRALGMLRPGIWEYEIQAEIEYAFGRQTVLGSAFSPIVGAGPNATILHYGKGVRRLAAADLVVIDVGARYGHYAADVTRTVPASGRFDDRQAAVYQIVLEAQKAAIDQLRPGSSFSRLQEAAAQVLRRGLHRLGLTRGAEGDDYRVYFPHGIGHWLGLGVHDVGSLNQVFRPGMVLTIEPGLYVRSDTLENLRLRGYSEQELARVRPAIEKYMHLGVRIEDVYQVTDSGHHWMSSHIPREMADLEANIGR